MIVLAVDAAAAPAAAQSKKNDNLSHLLHIEHSILDSHSKIFDTFTIYSKKTARNEELYLARPMGISPKNNGGGSTISSSVDSSKSIDTSNDIRSDVSRPSAPLRYLLPAARVGLYVYQTLAAAEEIQQRWNANNDDGKKENHVILQKLDELLVSSPPIFVTASDPTVSRSDPYGILPPVIGEIVAQQQKVQERKRQSISVGLTPQLFEPLELIGERRQWNRLAKIEKKRESQSEVRLALNIYTTNLNYNPNQYIFGGTTEEKRALIREDRLPSTVEVIRSDLDARDLYRNALQTALEDARAEERKNDRSDEEETMDVSELVSLLREAKFAIDKWFSFVPEQDVKEAMEIVTREKVQLIDNGRGS